jgi:hypothetical protein
MGMLLLLSGDPPPPYITVDQKNNFKLEEGKPTLLLLPPALIVETPVFSSVTGFGCRLVVGLPQAIADKTAIF